MGGRLRRLLGGQLRTGGGLADDEDRVDSQGDRPTSTHVQGRQTAYENCGAGDLLASSRSAARSEQSAQLSSSASGLPSPSSSSSSSSSSARGGGDQPLRRLDGAEERAVEGFKMDFEVPQTVDEGTTMCLSACLQQHQLPADFLAPDGGLELRVPFRVPRGGLRGGERVFGVCRQGEFWATSVSRQLVGGDVPAAGAGAGQGGRV